MIRLVHRSAKDGHDGIADIFVEKSLIFEDDIGHGRQILIEEVYEFLRGQLFRNGGEATDIGKHDGKILLVAPQFQFSGILEQFVDDRGRQIILKGPTDLLLFPFFRKIPVNGDDQIDCHHRKDGIDHVEPGIVFGKDECVSSHKTTEEDHDEKNALEGLKSGDCDPDDHAEKNDAADIYEGCPG